MTCLLADIGGTNTRCAVTGDDGAPAQVTEFVNRGYESPVPLLRRYVESLPADRRPTTGLLAVAAPVRDDEVLMVNIDWRFSLDATRDALRLRHLQALNDFEALAWALPDLRNDDVVQVGEGKPATAQPKGVLGPGTGLGVAALVPADGDWVVVGGEGGHVTLPASDAREERAIARIREQFGHCSAERVVSGPGLSLLHGVLHDGPDIDTSRIAELADADDDLATETFDVFFRLLGTVAANLALTVGAFGGIYIGGGIAPRHRDRFIASGFRKRFEAKGRYNDYLRPIPTYLIVADNPTLTGLAALARRRQERSES